MSLSKHIDKFGIEIEAAWEDDRGHPDFRIVEDHSLRRRVDMPTLLLEYVSRPFESIREARRALHDIYPGIVEVNPTMGLHVHVSLTKPKYYMYLASMDFQEFFMEWIRNSRMYERDVLLRRRLRGEAVNGREPYTVPIEDHSEIDQFLRGEFERRQERYKHVNLLALSHHNTIEFRVFPAMETPGEVLEAVGLVVGCVRKYLSEGDFLDEEEVRLNAPEGAVVTEVEEVEGGQVLLLRPEVEFKFKEQSMDSMLYNTNDLPGAPAPREMIERRPEPEPEPESDPMFVPDMDSEPITFNTSSTSDVYSTGSSEYNIQFDGSIYDGSEM